MASEILAVAIRGETVESIHRGHFAAIEGDGRIVESLGDPNFLTFIRSAAKPLQAIPFITSGAPERFGLLESEIALACGSHAGESFHIETAKSMLEKCGLTEKDLLCGTHFPFDDASAKAMLRAGGKPTQLHNNCSGKHSAMLAFAKHIGADLKSYESNTNPVQKKILETIAKFSSVDEDEIVVARDGCAAPNFALPVSGMARSFARLVFPPKEFDDETREACRRIISAMMNYPELIGGTHRFDTLIMKALHGRVISKIGAEGIYCAGILPSQKFKRGLGIAFKIEDGDDRRARPVVALEIFRQLGILDEDSAKSLHEFAPMILKNRRGDVIGKVVSPLKLNVPS
jgi:L-asparaginase II